MKDKNTYFRPEQVAMLKESAQKLRLALEESSEPGAGEIHEGELGKIIDFVLRSENIAPFEKIPHFDKMTKDFMPSIEDEYFDFYSLARYGVPAFNN